jgi:hypothetical protein
VGKDGGLDAPVEERAGGGSGQSYKLAAIHGILARRLCIVLTLEDYGG